MRRAVCSFYFVDDRAHELVGVEAAFHQRLDLAIARQCDRLGRCPVPMLRRHELIAGKVELGLFRCGSDFCIRPDQYGDDEFFLGGFDRANVSTGCTTAVRIGGQPACLFYELLVVAALHHP
jgi:hypothetical protein